MERMIELLFYCSSAVEWLGRRGDISLILSIQSSLTKEEYSATLEELYTERTGPQTHSDRVHSTQFLL